MDTPFCVEAAEEALDAFGHPDIFNTDQGSQFTAGDFTKPLLDKGIKVSMDGRGRWIDNVFIERFWRSLKYEEVYLRAYENLIDARDGIKQYTTFYNHERPHHALGQQPPATFYALMTSPDRITKEPSTTPADAVIDIAATIDIVSDAGTNLPEKTTPTRSGSN